MKYRLSRVAALGALALMAQGAAAEKPDWTSVAELVVGSIGEEDPARMALALNRCSAMHISLSGLLAMDSPGLSQAYEQEALRLMQSGILIQTRLEKAETGSSPDIKALSQEAATQVRGMVGSYNSWFSGNYDLNGSYFDNDENITIEMNGCQLASRFASRI